MATSANQSSGAGSFFARLGVSPAITGFLLLLLLAAGLVAFTQFQQTQKIAVSVLSSGQPVAGAQVQVYSPTGASLASGRTNSKGVFEVPSNIFSSGRLILKASKDGFVAANGDLQAVAVLDFSKRRPTSIELFSTEVSAADYYGAVSLLVLDKLTLQPIPSATLNIAAGGKVFPLSVSDDGRASLQLEKSQPFRVKVSAPGYYSDSFSLLALRPEEKILLSPRSAQEVSFDSGNGKNGVSLPPKKISQSGNLLGSTEDSLEFFMPRASLQILDAQGNAVQSGSVSVVSASGQEVFSAAISSGYASITSLPVSGDFRLVVLPQGSRAYLSSGSVKVFDPATNNLVFTASISSGSALLSPNAISPSTSPTQSGVLVLSASTLGGLPAGATFTLSNGASCTGSSGCALPLPVISSGGQSVQQVTVSAPGIASFTVSVPVSPGAVSFASIALPPLASTSNQVTLLGAFDSFGRQVSSVLPGHSYLLKFSFYSSAQDETVLSVRLGSKSNAAQEDYALEDFVAEDFSHSTKSISFSPKPVCDDLNNGLSQDGLYKWEQFFFENKGAPVQKIISLPFLVKPTASALGGSSSTAGIAGVQVFYRLESLTGSNVVRTPPDSTLENNANSPSKAGCYAQEQTATVPIALLSGCLDGTRENLCSSNHPLACVRNSQGTLALSPAQACCPQGFTLSNGACVSPSSQTLLAAGNCADGTAQGQCSNVNKPRACVGGQLSSSSTCCSSNEVFDGAACRPAGAPCRIGSFTFQDGACLPTKPGLCRAGIEVLSPSFCGCPQGTFFNAQENSCAIARGVLLQSFLACPDGTSLDACSHSKPKQCVSFGGHLTLVENSFACGCSASEVADGVGCRARQVVVVPGGATPSPTATPQPNSFLPTRTCSTPNSCLRQGQSDDFCDSLGRVVSSCGACNPTCSGNAYLQCTSSTGLCSPKKCLLPAGSGTPVGQCVRGIKDADEFKPFACVLDPDKQPLLIEDAGKCGCPYPDKVRPDPSGEVCVRCIDASCADAPFVCHAPDGRGLRAGECLDEKFSSSSGDTSSQPIQLCSFDGSISPSLENCGCPSGFQRSLDNTQCVRQKIASASVVRLSPEQACSGCVESDEIFFDFSSASIKTRSGKRAYVMRASTVFPADAFKLFLVQPAVGEKLSVKTISSHDASEACYTVDASTGSVIFHASRGGDACPISVQGNSFVHTGTGKAISSDSLQITFLRNSIPPVEAVIEIDLELSSQESVLLLPRLAQGPSTPQLLYLLNQKNDLSPRLFQLQADQPQSVQLNGAGLEVLAWRGPGSLSVSEGSTQVASVDYSQTSSFFACTGDVGGQRISSASDWRDCMTGWCNADAFRSAFSSFKNYVASVASASAFRRGVDSNGNPQPWTAVMGANASFKQVMAAQVVDGSARIIADNGIALSGFAQCGSFSTPGVFQITASTSDGEHFNYAAKVASLKPFDYVGGTCKDKGKFTLNSSQPDLFAPQQPLCRFLYGKCDSYAGGACIQSTSEGNLLTNKQFSNSGSAVSPLASLLPIVPPNQQGLPPFFPPGLGSAPATGGTGGNGGGGFDDFGNGPGGSRSPDPREAKLASHLKSPFLGVTNDQAQKPSDDASAKYSAEGFLGNEENSQGGRSDVSGPDSSRYQPKEDKNLNKKYVDSRAVTSKACGTMDGFEVDADAGKRAGLRKGSKESEYWVGLGVAQDVQNLALVKGKVSGAQKEAVVPFAAKKFDDGLKQKEADLKNSGAMLNALEDCENEKHGPQEKDTLEKFCRDKVEKVRDELFKKAKDAVQSGASSAQKFCETACNSAAPEDLGLAVTDPEIEQKLPEAKKTCTDACQAFVGAEAKEGNLALNQLFNRLGGSIPVELDKIKASSGEKAGSSTPASGGGPANGGSADLSCSEALARELWAGGDCEKYNKKLAGAPEVGGLLVEKYGPILKRTAWMVFYAYGEKNGGACKLVCQKKNSFMNVFTTGRKTYAVERYGLDVRCQPLVPSMASDSNFKKILQDPNQLSSFLNKYMPFGGQDELRFGVAGGSGRVKLISEVTPAAPGQGGLEILHRDSGNTNLRPWTNVPSDTRAAISRSHVAAFNKLGLNPQEYKTKLTFVYEGTGVSGGPSLGSAVATVIHAAGDPTYSLPSNLFMTGTSSSNGQFGVIGGVPQKMVGAIGSGSSLVMVSSSNYNEALRNAGGKVPVVASDSLDDTVNKLRHEYASLVRNSDGTDSLNLEVRPITTPQDLQAFDNPFDTTSEKTRGSGVLPSIGKGFNGNSIVPFTYDDVVSPPINGVPSGKAIPDKLSVKELSEKAYADEKEPACIQPFMDSLALTKDPIKYGKEHPEVAPNPSNQQDTNPENQLSPGSGPLDANAETDAVNQFRAQNGVGNTHLTNNPTLDGQAQSWAQHMADSYGQNPPSPVIGSGNNARWNPAWHSTGGYNGEIVALSNGANAQEALSNSFGIFRGSKDHAAHLFNPNYNSNGVGVAQVRGTNSYYVTMQFNN